MIGVFPDLNPLSGGVYQYGLTMLRALREIGGDDGDEFVLFASDGEATSELKRSGWRVFPVVPPTLSRRAFAAVKDVVGEERARRALGWLRGASRNEQASSANLREACARPEIARWLRQCGARLMIYPSPTPLAFELDVPSVMAVQDLQHRLQPEFPEVSANGEWERREYLYRHAAQRAALLIADSEVGREDVINFYGEHGATPERVKVLPFLPAHRAPTDAQEEARRRVRSRHRLPERFIFYPAQFWSHKNHARIVRALGLLKSEQNIEVTVVFCGSHEGPLRGATFREVETLARELGVGEQVCMLGYVPDEDVAALYAEAVALVMPTFFGPTNIPILEAWAANCPVLTSDIRGVREQAGDAALLVNPHSVEEIADGIKRLWQEDGLRCALAKRGRRQLSVYGPREFRLRLREIVDEAKAIATADQNRASFKSAGARRG